MSRRVRTPVAVAAFGVSIVLASPLAHADPDPHVPNPWIGWCPGSGQLNLVTIGYCDGVPYPDGTYWHHSPIKVDPLVCAIGGGAFPQLAPDGCGGGPPPSMYGGMG